MDNAPDTAEMQQALAGLAEEARRDLFAPPGQGKRLMAREARLRIEAVLEGIAALAAATPGYRLRLDPVPKVRCVSVWADYALPLTHAETALMALLAWREREARWAERCAAMGMDYVPTRHR